MIGLERNQYVRIHTNKGVTVDEYGPDHVFSLGWSREKNQVSKSELSVPSRLTENILPDLVPWLHWVSVWDETGTRLHWTGPVQAVSGNRDQITVSASDMGALFQRQPTPITKRWEATDPAYIANELVGAMIEQRGIQTQTLVRPDPRVEKFDFAASAADQMLDQTMNQLVDLGLTWAVSMGRPVLGPLSFKAQESFDGERDFIDGAPVVTRDGADMANEIIVRAPGATARARVPIEGLLLSRIVDIDSMFSVTNVQKVADQYVRQTARVRDKLQLPGNTRLHPEAPVDLDMLVPTVRFNLSAYGLLALMELTSMECKCADGDISVSISLEVVDDDPPELEEFTQSSSILGQNGGGR